MIVCVGEILADLIAKETEEGIVYSRHAGGAPFNVACGVKKLGGNAEFYGSVGNDLIGKYLKEFASRRGLGAHIRSIPDRNTTLAFVELDESGDRSFCFYRKNTADYRFDESAIGEIVEKADIVHLGSLALGEEEGRAFYDRLIAAAKRAGKRVSFDANYREDIFPDRNEALKIYGKYLAAADILKLSEEELYLFSGERGEEPAARELSKGKMLFVTLGKRGSIFSENGGSVIKVCAPDLKPVDTTGAGDAYYAGVLYTLDTEGIGSVVNAVKRGCVCGTLTTQKKGAIEAFPDLTAIAEYLG